MACDGERSKRGKVSSVSQRNQAKGDNDEQDGLFVDVVAKEKRRVAAERRGADKVLPRRLGLQKELDEGKRLEEQRQGEACAGADFRENGKRSVADETARNAL